MHKMVICKNLQGNREQWELASGIRNAPRISPCHPSGINAERQRKGRKPLPLSPLSMISLFSDDQWWLRSERRWGMLWLSPFRMISRWSEKAREWAKWRDTLLPLSPSLHSLSSLCCNGRVMRERGDAFRRGVREWDERGEVSYSLDPYSVEGGIERMEMRVKQLIHFAKARS